MRPVRPRTGPALLVIAAVHLVCTPLFHADGVRAVLDHGLINGVESGTDLLAARAAAFWYVAAGLLLVPLGYLCWTIEKRGHRLPAALGWILLAFTLVTGALVPLGGFWLFLLPAGFILWTHRRTEDPVQAQAPRPARH
jgi:hypothetical protein